MSTVGGGTNIVLDGLVLYLDAANTKSYVSGSTTWSDISRVGNNGTLINGPTFNSANGGSIVFDGSNDYATIDTPIGTGDFTISVWFRRPQVGTLIFIIGRYADGNNSGCMLFVNSNNLTFRLRADGTTSKEVIITPPHTSNWINITASATRTSNVVLYKNGVFDVQTSISSQQGNIPNLNFIGSFFGTNWFLNGNIAQTLVYNRALSATEVLQNYNATRTRYNL